MSTSTYVCLVRTSICAIMSEAKLTANHTVTLGFHASTCRQQNVRDVVQDKRTVLLTPLLLPQIYRNPIVTDAPPIANDLEIKCDYGCVVTEEPCNRCEGDQWHDASYVMSRCCRAYRCPCPLMDRRSGVIQRPLRGSKDDRLSIAAISTHIVGHYTRFSSVLTSGMTDVRPLRQ